MRIAMLRRWMPTAIKVALVGLIVYFIAANVPLKLADIETFLVEANVQFYTSMVVFAFFLMLQAAIWVMIVNASNEGVGGLRSGARLGLLAGLRIFSDSQFAKYIPGGFWNFAGRVMLTTRAGIALDAQLAAIVYENILLVSAALCYAVVLLVSLDIAPAVYIIAVLAVFAAAYVFYDRTTAWIRWLFVRASRWKTLRRVLGRLTAALGQEIGAEAAVAGSEAGLTRNRFFGSLACFIGSHMFMGIAFWMLTNSFGRGHVGLFYAAGTFATSWLVGLFSPLPGGLGVREGLLVYFLSLRLGAETALYISVIARLWNMMAEVMFWAAVRAAAYLTRRGRTYDEA